LAFNNKGECLRMLKRNEEAIACYDQALALNRNFTQALINKGLTLCELNRKDEAIRLCYDRVLDIEPNNEMALNNKGVALSDMRRYEEAIDCYDRALGLNQNFELARVNRQTAIGNKVFVARFGLVFRTLVGGVIGFLAYQFFSRSVQ